MTTIFATATPPNNNGGVIHSEITVKFYLLSRYKNSYTTSYTTSSTIKKTRQM